ncbi:MAG: single-stranded DNA-binding protein [Nostocales cyanobacterium ELA608]|jgi:single-strand DNA-binding protein
MNSCILMAEIYDDPQLRHTPDGLEITEMIVHVAGVKPDDPSHPLKVVGWGNLAKEIHQSYHQGDHVIIEGRLGMNTIDRPEGFKEKRAELTVQKIHAIGQGNYTSSPAAVMRTTSVNEPPAAQSNYVPTNNYESNHLQSAPVTQVAASQPTYQPPAPVQSPSPVGVGPEPDPDDIPF